MDWNATPGVNPKEVNAELRTRTARGAPPIDRALLATTGERSREFANAPLDAYERKITEAAKARRA